MLIRFSLENSLSELISVAEALRKMLTAFSTLGAEEAEPFHAYGRVLAEPITANHDFPYFDNSTMDGFAVRHADTASASRVTPVVLDVISDLPAGSVTPLAVGAGQAIRIMTGAPMPAGADGVIPVEGTGVSQSRPGYPAPNTVKIYRAIRPGENTRLKGQDIKAGEVVLEANRRLRAQDVSLIAMLGISRVSVNRQPVIAILSTGDELISLGAEWSAGKIYESNTTLIAALIEKYGGKPVVLGIAPDRPEAVKEHLDLAIDHQVDLIISTAGVSVGEYDYVRSVVERYGSLEFWRVNMRPGKPLAFGSYRGSPFVGLPGNPVSAFVGFEVFVRPAIYKMLGLNEWNRNALRVRILENVESDGRESFIRVIVEQDSGEWIARVIPNQGSGNLRSLVQANALLLLPSGVKSLPIGSVMNAWLLDGQ